ncbi:ogr/Delta-like zinc finger family protein [Pelagerythrobacter sp.]|uniref:ogr/Delta-like zinc finger family protein n=1 Tax=Pelagerythrobacter sp. TaxID=2800702 RepID=UPI0035B4693F
MSGEGAILASGPLIEAPLEFRLRSGGKLSPDRAFVVCPKCNAPAGIRHSERVTHTVKHLIAHCSNSGCGHIFRMELVFVHSLVEGNIVRPDLELPVCPRDQVPHVLPPVRDGPDEEEQRSMFATG